MKLKRGKKYRIIYSGSFCSCLGKDGYKEFSKSGNARQDYIVTFVGRVKTEQGKRNIFYNEFGEDRIYFMFGTKKTKDYVCNKEK